MPIFWRRPFLAFPGVQTDVMVIAARREESGLIAITLHHIETEHTVFLQWRD